jgi:hypothetical protein
MVRECRLSGAHFDCGNVGNGHLARDRDRRLPGSLI